MTENAFLDFLRAGIAKGGFETDDVLAAFLPLLKQVKAVHEAELVAPLDGLKHVNRTDQGHLMFAPAHVGSPQKNTSRVEALQAPLSHAVHVIGEAEQTADVDHGSITVSPLDFQIDDPRLTKKRHRRDGKSDTWPLSKGAP